MLRIVRATRADALADDLASEMTRSADLCDECFVIVQGPGMANWVRSAMVARCGAWGGVESPFLREFLLLLGARASGRPISERGREPQRELAYRIATCAIGAVDEDGDLRQRLAPFLGMCTKRDGDLDLATLLVRARSIAECFDRYEMDRPDLIESWEAHDEPWREPRQEPSRTAIALESWQRALWRSTVPGKWEPHERWKDLRELRRRLSTGEWPTGLDSIGFVSLFGVSTIPQLALDVLSAVGRHRPVSIHMLVPTMELLERGVSAKSVARMAARKGVSSGTVREAEIRDERNPLIATLGGVAAEAAVIIETHDGATVEDVATDVDALAAQTVLGEIQRAMECNETCRGDPARALGDASLVVHGVATATRGAEVIHDQVLAALAEIPGLRQEDIIILTPDLATHATPLEEVFREREPHLTLRVADRGSSRPDQVATVAAMVMRIALEDQSYASVRELIEHPVVVRALGLEAADVARVLDDLISAKAARFLDGTERAAWLAASGVDDDIHTLAWAIDRLVLAEAAGASPARERIVGLVQACSGELYGGGKELRAIGQVVDALKQFVAGTRASSRTLGEWVESMWQLLAQIVPPTEDEEYGNSHLECRQRIARLSEVAAVAALPKLSWAVARSELLSALEEMTEGRHYASGGITLARMAPMRSVPARVLILVGIEHGVFPRAARIDSLDLAACARRAGDRDARREDQLLVLEALHAARDRLIIVQRDRDATTGERIGEPAVLAEVFGVAAAAMGLGRDEARERLTVQHAPLADAAEEWADERRAGFDVASHARAVTIAVGAPSVPPPFATVGALGVAQPLPNPLADIKKLARAITRPVGAYLAALEVRPQSHMDLINTLHEPIELDSLDGWALDQALRGWTFEGISETEAKTRARCQGLLPHGEGCAAEWHSRWSEAAQISRLQREAQAMGKHVIVRKRARDDSDIESWIEHLEIAARVPDACVVSIEVGSGRPPRVAELSAISNDDASALLSELVALATRARTQLLPFHARLMKAWRACRGETNSARRRETLLAAFAESRMGPALARDAEITTAFRGESFFDFGVQASTMESPQCFDHLAAWIDERMVRVGWGEVAKK